MRRARESRPNFSIERLPKSLQSQFQSLYKSNGNAGNFLEQNHIYQGDARTLLEQVKPNSVALAVWSPPYFVGKEYESQLSLQDWQELLAETIRLHFPIIKPGGFLVINIADILVFKDASMPRIQAEVPHRRKSAITKEDVLRAMHQHPQYNRQQIAKLLGCSEQTIDRRLHGNNIRGGKHQLQSRVKIVGGMIEEWAIGAGFYPYDRRVWVKDAAWENSRWAGLSYRSVDEFEYIYFFWKPGITKYDRARLTAEEWANWGSRGVWAFPSVRANDDHEAKFPLELPTRVIRLLTEPDETVLDCFMGSGTTAIAALREGRNYIGIEKERKYVKLAQENISKESWHLC